MSKDKATVVAMTMTFTFLSLGSLAFTLLLLLLLLLNYYPAYAQQKDNNDIDKVSSITDGIASGDVRDHSAIVWSRANTQALLHVQYDTSLAFSHPRSAMVSVNQTTDFAGHVVCFSPTTIPNCFNKQLGCDDWATNGTTSSSSIFKKTFTRERSDFQNS